MESNFYYNILPKELKPVYHAIYNGLKDFEMSFPVPKVSAKELSEIYFNVRLDHPEIFTSTEYKYRFYQNADHVELIPQYLFDKKKLKEHDNQMKARVDKLIRPWMNLSDEEKLLRIHDFICENVIYDKLKKAYSHEIIGPLGQGIGVCEGIAKTVKILCDKLNIWCIIAICDNNPEKNIKYRHTWNIVKLNKSYYHFDVTFDNSLGDKENIRYDYFLLPDEKIYRDHEPAMYQYPPCTDKDHFYYKEKKLSFTKLEDVEKRVEQAVRKGKTLTLHWRGGYLTRSVLEELIKTAEDIAAKKNKHVFLSLNYSQAVLRFRFETEVQKEQLLMEEANEGELYEEA